MIFIDEIDSVGAKRTNSVLHPYANQTINQLLSEMDGFHQNEGVIVLGATNRRDDLDQALLRPGRFDVEVSYDILFIFAHLTQSSRFKTSQKDTRHDSPFYHSTPVYTKTKWRPRRKRRKVRRKQAKNRHRLLRNKNLSEWISTQTTFLR